ncbi:MAG TPA: flavin reductase family protein [Verrucomicrobiae bacterium]|nr:flavin reductase family protein [Verrucomicrobiae bacterium]
MTRQPIKLFDLWQETIDSLTREGLLLCTVGGDGKPNVMTIGWLTGGAIWSKPILVVLVRPSRFTYERLNEVHEFTVNVLPSSFAEAIQHCGTASGRDGDKFSYTSLKPVPAQTVRAPIIEQGVVHYECRVVHTNEVIPANLTSDIKASAYHDGDYHRVYFGEVLAAYAVPDAREKLRRALL